MGADASRIQNMEDLARLRRGPHAGRRPLATTAGRITAPARPVAPEPISEGTHARAAVERRERVYRLWLALADMSSAAAALMASLALAGDDMPSAMLIWALPLIVVVSKLQGLYDRDDLLIRKSTLDELPQLFQLSAIYTLVIWILGDAFVIGTLSGHQVLGMWASLFVLSAGGRWLARRAAAHDAPPERCMFIGDAGSYDRLKTKLEGRRIELVGRLSMQRVARRGARSASTEELRDLFDFTNADRVIIEPAILPASDMHDLVRAAKSVGIRVSLLPRVFDVVGSAVVMDEIDGMTILGVRRFGLTRSSALIKRSFDLCGAFAGLVAVAPVMALIALAIKLDSRGPVLFRQERVGRGGRRFYICKFRTMCVDAEERKAELRGANEAEGLFKIADDPRITRVGRLLRKTSLDELPQLFNVLFGDMSLVGPRPLVVDEDQRITGLDRKRLTLTPGMTGHWQILGSARVPLHEMVKIDYLYVAGWSLWSDVKILLRTVPYMLARRGM